MSDFTRQYIAILTIVLLVFGFLFWVVGINGEYGIPDVEYAPVAGSPVANIRQPSRVEVILPPRKRVNDFVTCYDLPACLAINKEYYGN